MGTITHFKNLYISAFDECKPGFLVSLLKVYSVFSAVMLFLAIYAFMFRAVNGFEF